MKKSKIKYIFEMVFIFALPLLFMICCFNIQKQYTYDNNGNYETSNYTLVFNSPIDLTTTEERTGTYETFNYDNLISETQTEYDEYFEWWYHDGGWLEWRGYETLETSYNWNIDTILAKNLQYSTINNDIKISLDIVLIETNNTDHTYNNIQIERDGIYSILQDSGYSKIVYDPNNDFNFVYVYNGVIWEGVVEFLMDNRYFEWENEEIDLGNYDFYANDLTKYGYIENTYTYYEQTENINLFGKIENLICNTLQISNNIVIDIIIVYTFLWFVMFAIWHLFYLLLDFLLHFWKKEDD